MQTNRLSRMWVVSALAIFAMVLMAAIAPSADESLFSGKKARPEEPEISAMGAIARGDVPRPYYQDLVKERREPFRIPAVALGLQGDDRLVHSPTAVGFQSENTIAVNKDFVVVGFNDIRGFGATVSVSGYAYSGDGGATWTDGGQLPLLTGTDQVYGDPDVKTWTDGGGQIYFFYSSLYTTTTGNSSLCVHVSADGGATWTTPREVTTATSATDFCDKEFMCVDPETGRIIISWTNFGASTTIRTVHSDDKGLTWSAPTVFASSGQGSIPRCAPRSNNAYIAWRSGTDIKFVTSLDNGNTWGPIYAAATGVVTPESPYGSDRINNFPSMDVDTLGNAHVVFASQNIAGDFSDVYYFTAYNPGTSFSAPVAINSNPGNDRGQFFTSLSVNRNTQKIDVIWYDQIRGQGTADLTDVFHTHSIDGGATWSCPAALTDKTFHAEYGNNTSQPNIGDYIQCTSGYDDEPNKEINALYAAFAKTDEPLANTYAPDTYVDISGTAAAAPIALPPDPYTDVFTSFTDYGCLHDNGYLEPGEKADLAVTIWEYANCGAITGIQGTIATSTPNVSVLDANAVFGNLGGLGSTATNLDPFTIQVSTAFTCGDPIDVTLDITSSAGAARLVLRLHTGVPQASPVLEEKFDGVAAPALPAGWSTSTISGTANPWRTSTTYASSGPNAAYCADIGTVSLNRLASPAMTVPGDCDLLDVTFDITHNLEDAGGGTRLAWDGALLKVRIGGSQIVLAGAFSYDFDPFYPNQFYRMSGASANPLQDLACWSGDVTPNFSSVHLQFPGLAGQQVELLWDLGTDGAVGTASGMFVDNVVVRSIAFACSTCVPTGIAGGETTPPAFRITGVVPNPFNPETTIRFTLPERVAVTGEVWSVKGERVRVLARDRVYDAGENSLRWNGRNDNGEAVASGVYFVRLKSRIGEQVTRAVLLK